MTARVICLSRAICAGAEDAAAEIAKELGYRCVDEEIIARAAERQNLDPEEVADVERRKSFFAQLFEDIGRGGGVDMVAYVPHAGVMPLPSEDLRALIRDAITETAAQGGVVIIAHAASYALGKRDDVLRVLITGSLPVRAGRLATAEGKSLDEAEEAVRESDAARADYLERFYEVDRELAEHYDVTVSTDLLTPSQAAKVILSAARAVRD